MPICTNIGQYPEQTSDSDFQGEADRDAVPLPLNLIALIISFVSLTSLLAVELTTV